MAVVINGDTGISPVTASGTSASVDGMTVGRGGGEVSTNTAVGASALQANTSGAYNTILGYQAGYSNTTGSTNVAIGRTSFYNNTTGSDNTAVGHESGYSNTTGTANTALGQQALRSNTTASNNTAVGYQSSYSLATNSFSTTVGYQSGKTHTDGYVTAVGYNAALAATSGYSTVCAIGVNALAANTTGANNTAVGGYNTLTANTTGSSNVAVGREALAANTTASNNTAVGYQAGYSSTTGDQNVYLGVQAGYTGTTGTHNLMVGFQAGYSSTGSYNTFVGCRNASDIACGQAMTTGTRNTILGGYSGNQGGVDSRTASNAIILSDGDGNPKGYFGGSAYGEFTLNSSASQAYNGILNFAEAGTNKVQQYYQKNVTSFYVTNNSSGGVYLGSGATAWASASDERLKDIIEPIENGLTKVSSLRAVIGKFKTDAEGTRRSFLIAQDVQAVLPEAISTTMVKDDETNTEYLGVSYTDVIPLLVSAIKELKAEFDAYKATHP